LELIIRLNHSNQNTNLKLIIILNNHNQNNLQISWSTITKTHSSMEMSLWKSFNQNLSTCHPNSSSKNIQNKSQLTIWRSLRIYFPIQMISILPKQTLTQNLQSRVNFLILLAQILTINNKKLNKKLAYPCPSLVDTAFLKWSSQSFLIKKLNHRSNFINNTTSWSTNAKSQYKNREP
jgi:hypothetical protein